MKKNIMKFAAVAALTVALSACKKSESDDDTITLALLYLVDQTSGNCVTITKDDAAHSGAAGAGDGKPTYLATGSTKPKAACGSTFNAAFIVNNPDAVVTSVQASYQAAKTKATDSGSNCAATITGLQALTDSATVLRVQQSLAADGGNCVTFSPGGPFGTLWNLNPLTFGGSSVSVDPNPEYFGKTVYACSSEQAKERRLLQLKTQTFSTITGSVATDMATNLTFWQKSVAVPALNFKWTAEAIAAGRLINVTELTTAGKSGAALVAFGGALLGGNRACAKDVLSKESEAVQNIAFSIADNSGNLFAGAMTGNVLDSVITTAQAATAKEVLFTSLQCKYGDFDEEAAGNKTTVGTETNVKNIGTCPATYPKI
ncbi:lipoprotein LipL36 [Leptospira weilii]|nr:lipoprotein LipL36 [Leptospira weilii]MDL5246194.1 lipoprotein LipL36 [Leptospira weilii]ULH29181.1 lipoprotein LipL36 [Leptospira weilii]UPY79186.1 lipoprotein LipL36 [Leptospira weilii]